MKIFKKISFVLCTFIMFLLFNDKIYAANANISVNASKSTVVVGDNVTITYKLSSSSPIQGWDFTASYDSDYFSFVSSNMEGSTQAVNVATNSTTKNKTYTMKLKAKKSGSTMVGVKNIQVVDTNDKAMVTSSNKTKVIMKTQAEINASLSSNNNLNSLSISDYFISPKFDKDTKNYSLTVENSVEEIKINASKADNKASVKGIGTRKLEEGVNKIEVIVTAENGNKKTYVINVTRKELEPIKVILDNQEYNVVQKKDRLTIPDNYIETTVTIEEKEVPGFISEVTNYTLVGLSDKDGNINLYVYKDNKYLLYKEYKFNSVNISLIDTDNIIKGFKETKIKINDEEITAYISDKYNYKLLYGMNTGTGKTNWYSYDEEENTLQRYIDMQYKENISKKIKDNKLGYTCLNILFGSVSGIMFIIIIVLMFKKSN